MPTLRTTARSVAGQTSVTGPTYWDAGSDSGVRSVSSRRDSGNEHGRKGGGRPTVRVVRGMSGRFVVSRGYPLKTAPWETLVMASKCPRKMGRVLHYRPACACLADYEVGAPFSRPA
jgi:hypothetical protein